MEDWTEDFEKIKRDLEELRKRFSEADIVLSNLEEIQLQFESLVETHKKLKEYVSEVSRFNAESNEILKLISQSQENFEKSFVELKEANTLNLGNLESKLLENREAFDSYNQDLRKIKKQIKWMINGLIFLAVIGLCLLAKTFIP